MPIEKPFGSKIATGENSSGKPVGMVLRKAKDAIEKTGFAKRSWHAVARVATIGMLAAFIAGAENLKDVNLKKANAKQISAVEKKSKISEKQQRMNKALLDAVSDYVTVASVENLLRQGADPNARNEHGWTALICAAAGGSVEAVKLLVGKGADVNATATGGYGETALMRAAWVGSYDVCKFLIEKRAKINARDNDGLTVLMWAAVLGHHEKTWALFIERYAKKGGNVKGLIEAADKDGKTALMHAACSRDTSEYKALISAYAKAGGNLKRYIEAADKYGMTVLMYAAQLGLAEFCEFLVSKYEKAGGDVKNYISKRDKEGMTALGYAKRFGLPAAIEYLESLGAKE
jgi:ankyrin repeat protein